MLTANVLVEYAWDSSRTPKENSVEFARRIDCVCVSYSLLWDAHENTTDEGEVTIPIRPLVTALDDVLKADGASHSVQGVPARTRIEFTRTGEDVFMFCYCGRDGATISIPLEKLRELRSKLNGAEWGEEVRELHVQMN